MVTDADGLELLNISGNWGGYQSVTFEVTSGLELDELVEARKLFIRILPLQIQMLQSLAKSEEVKLELV